MNAPIGSETKQYGDSCMLYFCKEYPTVPHVILCFVQFSFFNNDSWEMLVLSVV